MQCGVEEDQHAAFPASRRDDALLAMTNGGLVDIVLQSLRRDREYWKGRCLIIILNGMSTQPSCLIGVGTWDKTKWPVQGGHVV